MDFKTFKEQVFAAAEGKNLTQYEIYYQGCNSTVATAFQDEINEFSASNDGGVCFRCIYGGKMGYASTEALDDAEGLVTRAMDNAAVLEADEQVFLAENGQNYRKWSGKNYKLPDTKQLLELTLAAQRGLYAAGAEDGTSARGVAEENVIELHNSGGLSLKTKVNICALILSAVVSKGAEKATHYKFTLSAPESFDIPEICGEAVRLAREKLGGGVPQTGACPVIFDPQAMSDLLGVFSEIFFASRAQKGLSKLAGKEGQVIAAPCVTIMDDPFHPQSPIPMTFDGEGSPTKTKKVIDGGVLSTLLYNLKTAHVAGKKTTGNASKAGYSSDVGTRPYAFYICGGDKTEEELLREAGSGVYITSLAGLHAGANAITGDFSLHSTGFLIENGKKTDFIKGFTVAGNFYKLLQDVRAVANNSCLPEAIGMTAYGAPSTLVDGLTVAGK